MKPSTIVFQHRRSFITVSRNGPAWYHGWHWEVHAAINYRARSPIVGPLTARGNAPFKILARAAGRNHADRYAEQF
jgi:hypothetical protein